MIFSIISLTVFIIAFVWLFTSLQAAGRGAGDTLKWWRQHYRRKRAVAHEHGWLSPSSLRYLSYFFALDFLLLLAITGFFQPVFLLKPMSGLLLLLHLTIAPFFAAALLIFVLFWVEKQKPKDGESSRHKRLKMCFWTILVLACVSILSIGLSMFPLAGTQLQLILLAVHKYAAVALVVAAVVHAYFVIQLFMKQQ
ncbi:MAG: hypothetical protein H6696_04325 [Deferribacteres bacterium]|nr:hypothetical protein [candidate division KSB1 bacterium]MCB9501141.1 hypothetical protein [Deferribacteres bacterium]